MSNEKVTAAVVAILKELGVALDTSSMESRIQMQKAIYLAQAIGVDLGYRFGWYVRGPYSSALADDYYGAAKDPRLQQFVAAENLKVQLEPLAKVISKAPQTVSAAGWLEAVASLDYMLRVQRVPETEIEKRFIEAKPHLAAVFEEAKASRDELETSLNASVH